MKRICVSVSSDLVSDNRVNKTCFSLQQLGLDVVLIGRRKRTKSLDLAKRSYCCLRMNLLFETSFLFYAELNLRLFIYLLFHKQDILWSNDLDTLPANYLVSRLKNKPLIFDSHEHFTEVPELKYNLFAKKTWKRIERTILPRLKYVITVCNPIAAYFKENYAIEAIIVRNMLPKSLSSDIQSSKPYLDMAIDNNKPILIWQGAINIERGIEELLEAMTKVEAYLYIIGDGKIVSQVKQMAKRLKLDDKVFFLPRMPYQQMIALTQQATLGLSLDKNTNTNYAISLPNKVFEYISAHIPILASDLSEIRATIEQYEVGEFIWEITPKEIAKRINEMLNDDVKLAQYKANTYRASEILCWENEEKKIQDIVENILNKK